MLLVCGVLTSTVILFITILADDHQPYTNVNLDLYTNFLDSLPTVKDNNKGALRNRPQSQNDAKDDLDNHFGDTYYDESDLAVKNVIESLEPIALTDMLNKSNIRWLEPHFNRPEPHFKESQPHFMKPEPYFKEVNTIFKQPRPLHVKNISGSEELALVSESDLSGPVMQTDDEEIEIGTVIFELRDPPKYTGHITYSNENKINDIWLRSSRRGCRRYFNRCKKACRKALTRACERHDCRESMKQLLIGQCNSSCKSKFRY